MGKKSELLHYLELPDSMEGMEDAVGLLDSLRQPDWDELIQEYGTEKLTEVLKVGATAIWTLARVSERDPSTEEASVDISVTMLQSIFGAGFREGWYHARRKSN